MNKTIYVRDEGQWDKIKLIAEQGGVSVSELILSQFEGSGVRLGKETQMDRIESKLDALIGGQFHRAIPMATDGLSEGFKERVEDDIAMLAKKQAELDAKKAKRNIKKEKIEKVRERVIGYSKERQLGK